MSNVEFADRVRARSKLWCELVGAGKDGLPVDELDPETVRDIVNVDFAHVVGDRLYVGRQADRGSLLRSASDASRWPR